MKIAHLKISNVLGLTAFELSPGPTLTEISGPNGTGKTSVLEAIRGAAGAGHDATLLRKGAERGETVLVFDDGTELHQRVTPTRTTRELIVGGQKVPSPASAIKALTDMLSVNPVEFLTARKADRVRVLLEIMPLVADPVKLQALSGIPVYAEAGLHALAVIDHVRKQVFDDRTGTNRAVKDKRAAMEQVALAMPDVPEGVDGNEDDLQAYLDQARDARDTELARVRTKIDGVRVEYQARVDAIMQAMARAVAMGLACSIVTGRGHFKLRATKAGVTLDVPVSCSPTDPTACINMVAQMLRSRFAERGVFL